MSAEGQAPAKPVSAKVPYYAFLTEEADLATLKAFALQRSLPEANALRGDIASAADFLRSNPSPGVLFVEIPSREAAADLLQKLADAIDPETKVIVVGTVNEFSFYCWLMELGISSYLLKPLTQPMLEGAWSKATAPIASPAVAAKAPTTFIAFTGARGGVGATTLAIMTTALLAQQEGRKVAILDLDPLDGSVSLMLDVDPSRGLREALERPDRIDGLFLDRTMQKAPGGFYVLSSEEPLHAPITLHEGAAEALIEELKKQFDYVVIDASRAFNHFVRRFLQECEHKFLVTDMSLQGLRDTLRITDLLRDVWRIRPPLVIANRVGLAGKQEMGNAEFKKGLNGEITFHIPFAPDFFMQIGGEMEALKNKKAPALKVLQQLVERIVPPEEGANVKKKPSFWNKGK